MIFASEVLSGVIQKIFFGKIPEVVNRQILEKYSGFDGIRARTSQILLNRADLRS